MIGLLYERPTNSTPSNKILHKSGSIMEADSGILRTSNFNEDRRISTDSVCSTDDIVYSNEIISIKDGKYEYEDSANALLGRGSWGKVFKGLDRRKRSDTTKVVAIKCLTRLNVKPDELKAMKRVRNNNLVALIDVCDEGFDLTYFIMEYCDSDLDRHLRYKAKNGQLDKFEMKTIVESITRGYYALYENKIVHRDIKPQNILIIYDHNSKEDQSQILTAKITDFGISRILADESQLSNVAGSLNYMAPEVGANLLRMCEYDHCADMWSIGCVIYQCHTGLIPFDERNLCRLFLHCAGGNYEAYEMPELPEDTTPELRLLIKSLLQIDRTKRINPKQLYEEVMGKDKEISSASSSTVSLISLASTSSRDSTPI